MDFPSVSLLNLRVTAACALACLCAFILSRCDLSDLHCSKEAAISKERMGDLKGRIVRAVGYFLIKLALRGLASQESSECVWG